MNRFVKVALLILVALLALKFLPDNLVHDEIALDDLRTVIAASSAGTTFEWYDFFVFGSLTGVISKTFFTGLPETAALAAALALFGTGFLFRPLGALVLLAAGLFIPLRMSVTPPAIQTFAPAGNAIMPGPEPAPDAPAPSDQWPQRPRSCAHWPA